MNKTSTAAKRSNAERRSGKERRRRDTLAPGLPERRRSIEPRKPEVQELELSPSQWADLENLAAPKKSEKGGKSGGR